MRSSGVFSFSVLTLLLSVQAVSAQSGGEETVNLFGPTQFTRTTGGPRTTVATFSVDATIHGPFHLTVMNGGTDGTDRVSGGRISLNGTQLFGPSDFNQNVSALDRDVQLDAQNTVEVELASAPDGFLTVLITGRQTQVFSSVGLTRAAPAFVTVDVPTQITVTSIILANTVVPSSVALERVNPDGTTSSLGMLHDDGVNGDASLGDRIFTTSVSLNESVPQELRFRVSAVFAGPPTRRDTSEPFSIFVRPSLTAEATLNQLASELAAGDIEAALTHFSPSPRHRKILASLTADQRNGLAAAFAAAHLATSQDDMRVFEVQWQDDNGTIAVNLTLAQSRNGDWVIISW